MTDRAQELKDIAAEITSLQTRNQELSVNERTALKEGNEVRETIWLLEERQRTIEEEAEEEAGNPSWPKRTQMYLHSNKEYAWEVGEELGLSDEALGDFRYALYEVTFEIEVNKDGTYKILNVSE